MPQKTRRMEADSGCDLNSGIDVVFLDIDGVLLPFDPSEQYSSDEDAPACWDCSNEDSDEMAAWQCDICSRCFCSACRCVLDEVLRDAGRLRVAVPSHSTCCPHDRAVEICPRCERQICSFCAEESECESCRAAISAAPAARAQSTGGVADDLCVSASDEARGTFSIPHHSRDVSNGLAEHFNFQPPPSADVIGSAGDDGAVFPDECMDNLVAILEQTGACIVLSSTWRKRPEWHQGKPPMFGRFYILLPLTARAQ